MCVVMYNAYFFLFSYLFSVCSRSESCRDECISPQLTHTFLMCKYPLPPPTGSILKTQTHTLTAQILADEDLTPLTTPMLIEDG